MSLEIQENIFLKDLTTFQIGGPARYLLKIKNEDDLRAAFSFAKTRHLSIFVLGGGSNLLISDKGFNGLVIKNEIKGIKFIDKNEDRVILEVGSGENLDELIDLVSSQNIFGLENLSGIPGTVGGAAVQNAGAYGSELKDFIISISGLNINNGKEFTYERSICQYGYRDSIFKKNKKLFITRISLELNKKPAVNIEYQVLKDKLNGVSDITPLGVRTAVLNIRNEKLPDWHILGTAGSFFKNPIISTNEFSKLKEKFPNLPSFVEEKSKIKLPLAWILDQLCQLRGYREDKIGLYEKQPIVLVNFGEAKAEEVINFSKKIKNLVRDKTGLEIFEEVEIIK